MSYILTNEAEEDIGGIVKYTKKYYGAEQARKYAKSIEKCILDLSSNEKLYKSLTEIHPSLKVKNCQKHYIFGVLKNDKMLIVAILHEKMDLIKRVRGRLGFEEKS